MKYDNIGEARDRLNGTVIQYQGEPIYVHSLQGDGRSISLLISPLEEAQRRDEDTKLNKVSIKDEGLDFKSPPLGYYNRARPGGGSTASYVSRIPARRYKQGLDARALTILKGNSAHNPDGSFHLRLTDTILGKYPTFEEVLTTIKKKGPTYAQAFDRHFCLEKNTEGSIRLEWRGKDVGYIGKKTSKVYLARKFKFLKENIADIGLKVGGSRS